MSGDRTARVWDAATGLPITQPLTHDNYVNFAAFSPEGEKLVTLSSDGKVYLWDAQVGSPLAWPMHHGRGVRYAAFSPDGRCVVSSGLDGGAPRMAD